MKNCQDSTLDIERSSFERLSLKERLELRMHVSICPECRKYFRDSKAIDKLLKKRFNHMGVSEYNFTKEEKEEMKRKIAG